MTGFFKPLLALSLFACFWTKDARGQVRAPVDSLTTTSWKHLLAGNQLLVNSQLLDPAGQSLDLGKGVRILNLEFARGRKLLIAKANKHVTFIDAAGFKKLGQFDYLDKESGSMNGLFVDDNDSTVYFTGLNKNLYIGNVSSSGHFALTKTIDLSVNKKKSLKKGCFEDSGFPSVFLRR